MEKEKLRYKLEFLKEELSLHEKNKENHDTTFNAITWLQNEICEIEWTLLSEDEKQAARIEWVAVAESKGYSSIEDLWLSINIYQQIRLTIPYILLLNRNGDLDLLISLCEKQIKIIDEDSLYLNKFVSSHEIEKAFKPFFEEIKHSPEYEDFATFLKSFKIIDELYGIFCKIKHKETSLELNHIVEDSFESKNVILSSELNIRIINKLKKKASLSHIGKINRNTRIQILTNIEKITKQLPLKERKRFFLICVELLQDLFSKWLFSQNPTFNLNDAQKKSTFLIVENSQRFRIVSWNYFIFRKKENIAKEISTVVAFDIKDLKKHRINLLQSGMSYKPSMFLPLINLVIWCNKKIIVTTTEIDNDTEYLNFEFEFDK